MSKAEVKKEDKVPAAHNIDPLLPGVPPHGTVCPYEPIFAVSLPIEAVSALAVSTQRSCATSWSQMLDVHAVEVPWRGSIAVLLFKHIHQDGPFLVWLLLHRNPRQGGAVASSLFPTANVQEDGHLYL